MILYFRPPSVRAAGGCWEKSESIALYRAEAVTQYSRIIWFNKTTPQTWEGSDSTDMSSHRISHNQMRLHKHTISLWITWGRNKNSVVYMYGPCSEEHEIINMFVWMCVFVFVFAQRGWCLIDKVSDYSTVRDTQFKFSLQLQAELSD